MFIRDVMTRSVVSVGPETPLKDVARLLVEHRVSGLPVVDANGRVLGIVSEADFVARSEPEPEPRGLLGWLIGDRKRFDAARARLRARTAGEAMTTPAMVIGPNRPLSEAALTMREHAINRLPVVEEDRLVGIVTRADVVRAYARSDSELAELLRDTLRGVDGMRVVAVRDGVAILSGTVAHEAIAETAREIAMRIEGIVAVDDERVAWLEPRHRGAPPDLEARINY